MQMRFYYKTKDNSGRERPGVVLGRNGEFVLMWQGRSHFCVHLSIF